MFIFCLCFYKNKLIQFYWVFLSQIQIITCINYTIYSSYSDKSLNIFNYFCMNAHPLSNNFKLMSKTTSIINRNGKSI